jgi:uncharacterized protein YlxW (UPF0749 family)
MEARPPRVALPLAAAIIGFLAVTAALQPPAASRAIRRLELTDLVRAEDGRVRTLRREVRDLEAQLEALEGSGAAFGELEAEVKQLSVSAGTAGLEGLGVVVTLDDSTVARSPTGDPNDLVVHERDIQTVVNALWAAGAEAMAVNDERLTAGSAVRCAGNTLLLHGTLHSPPYRIAAIGDQASLSEGLETGPGLDRLQAAVGAFGLRLDVEAADVAIEGGLPLPTIALASPA